VSLLKAKRKEIKKEWVKTRHGGVKKIRGEVGDREKGGVRLLEIQTKKKRKQIKKEKKDGGAPCQGD